MGKELRLKRITAEYEDGQKLVIEYPTDDTTDVVNTTWDHRCVGEDPPVDGENFVRRHFTGERLIVFNAIGCGTAAWS